MKCHADFESGYPVVSSFQNWEEHQQSAALMLYCFGTQPSINAADPDIHFKALRRMQQKLEKQFDAIHESEGGRDPRFIVTKLNDTMQECNKFLLDLQALLGLGIYAGGVLLYRSQHNFLVIPFGGCRAYNWDKNQLHPLGSATVVNGVITNALGAQEKWNGQCVRTSVPPDGHLFCTTESLMDLTSTSMAIQSSLLDISAHERTLSMLLRRELTISPAAVLHLTY